MKGKSILILSTLILFLFTATPTIHAGREIEMSSKEVLSLLLAEAPSGSTPYFPAYLGMTRDEVLKPANPVAHNSSDTIVDFCEGATGTVGVTYNKNTPQRVSGITLYRNSFIAKIIKEDLNAFSKVGDVWYKNFPNCSIQFQFNHSSDKIIRYKITLEKVTTEDENSTP